jgi:ligand-binding sensor domain-containing protein/signal transduction histidine kinase
MLTLAVLGFLLLVCSCAKKQPATNPPATNRSPVALHRNFITRLSNEKKPLPVFLSDVPKPLSKQIQAASKPTEHAFIDSLTGLPIPEDAQGKGLFTTYTTDEGLALDQVYCSYKDRNGNLWFGTSGGGVSKYDGRKFTNYTKLHGLSNNVIWCILQDRDGNLWFGTDGNGVSKYDGKIFKNYTEKDGLANDVVYSMKQDRQGNIWFGTLKGGVSKYDARLNDSVGQGKRFTNYTTASGLAGNAVSDIIEDKEGNMWFATLGGGLSRYNARLNDSVGQGKIFTNFNTANGLSVDTVRCICQDKKGNIWFGAAGGYLNKFDGNKFSFYTKADEPGNNEISAIIEDSDGNIWAATRGGGAIKFDGKRFTSYTTAQGLVSNNVRCITEDDKGDLWFGTFGGGVSRYEGKSFSNYTVAQGLPANVVYSISEDSTGSLWMGTFGGGICKYNGKAFTYYNLPPGIGNKLVYSTAVDHKGNLWFGSFEGGVVKFNGKTFTNYTTQQGLAGNIVFCIKEDRAGNLWFGTSGGGVSKFDGKSFTNYTKTQGLPDNEIFCITEDNKGNLWFGSSGAGISKFDGESFTNIGTAEGLPDNLVWAITEDKGGNLWVGTQQGLSVMPQNKLAALQNIAAADTSISAPLFENFTSADGLPDNFITQVITANDNKLYIGTNLGICEMIPGGLPGDSAKHWHAGKIFNSGTGFPVKDVNAGMGAMLKDSRGIIWIGTGSDKTGLVRFDPRMQVNHSQKPPVIVIQSIKINQENLVWSDLNGGDSMQAGQANIPAPHIAEELNTFGRILSDAERNSLRKRFADISFRGISNWYPLPEKLVLSHDKNSISFDFNAIETGKNNLVTYQYMLEGYDKQWSPASHETSATFGNIFEGTYTFLVKAKAAGNSWTDPVKYTFRVLPPWWRTWWMFLLYAVTLVSVIVLIFRWNNKRIISQKHVLEQKVALATAEIRQEKENVEAQKKLVEGTLKDLKSTQAQLIQAEKMASLGELTAGIAHEIQNPLNFVNNFSELSRDLIKEMNDELARGELEEARFIAADIEQNLEKIHHHGKRAESIVSGMLEHSRTSSGQKVPTDINKLTDEFLRLAYHGIRAKNKKFSSGIHTDFDPSLEKIDIIPQDMGRVILNLVTNAFHAVGERANEDIEGYKPEVSASTRRLTDSVELIIRDNGNGIPDRIRGKIFQPFFTTKPTGQGTGLGLSLSYDIVKAHGGEIVVETNAGTGTSFKVIIPV